MRLFPASASVQLEFEKVKVLLQNHCQGEYAKSKAEQLRIHTKKEFIETELRQTHEYRQLSQHGTYFPNEHILNLTRELKLLSIPGAVLSGAELILIRKLAESLERIFRWFNAERKLAYPALALVIKNTSYEKKILELVNEVIDDIGQLVDNASPELRNIRMSLYKK